MSHETNHFQAYFNVADELSDLNTKLEHLDALYVREARLAVKEQAKHGVNLPWPPDLATAEEFLLDHPEFMRGEHGW